MTPRYMQALSVNIRKQTLDGAARNITRLNTAIEAVKRTDTQRLQARLSCQSANLVSAMFASSVLLKW